MYSGKLFSSDKFSSGDVRIEVMESRNQSMQIIQELSKVICYENIKDLDKCINFWTNWLYNEIPGEKLTIVAKYKKNIVGVVRIWNSPFCEDKWLIEGLHVITPRQGYGIEKTIVKYAIDTIRDMTNSDIYVHLNNENIESISVHEGLGFKKISTGCINSFGQVKENYDEYILIE